MASKKTKVTVVLRDREIAAYLDPLAAQRLIDQVYDVFSGEFDDNCIEIQSDNNGSTETVLMKADEVIYVKSQEVLSDE